MTLGQRIQELRKQHSLSQEALGEAMGITRQAISKWESDQTIPDVDNLVALSKLFSVPVGQLLGVEAGLPPAHLPTKMPGWVKLWLAGLTTLGLLLTGTLGWLWTRYIRIEELATRTEITNLPYTAMNSAPLFQSLDCQFSPLELGFPQNKGTQDLTVTITIDPVEQLDDWNLLPLYVKMKWTDPWRKVYPKATHTKDWTVEMKRSRDGVFSGSFTIEDYPGGEMWIDACFQEEDSGLTVEINELMVISSTISEMPDYRVETLDWSPGSCGAKLPVYMAKTLPDPKYIGTFSS